MSSDLRTFDLVDRYLAYRMGTDVSALSSPGLIVVESERRLRPEPSYGFVHVLWWVEWVDGRSLLSVPPGAGPRVAALLAELPNPVTPGNADCIPQLDEALGGVLAAGGRTQYGLLFACDKASLRPQEPGEWKRLADTSIPPAEGLTLPTHCFPDGLVCGVVVDGCVAAVAYAHRSGIMEGLVADVGVETAPAYRRRGYARMAVVAVAQEVARSGGQVLYHCAETNAASAATAASAGFVTYGRTLALTAPARLRDS
ncbi:MAG: GNAT family N-acetyltransferase [Anaerolineae bacterium]